MNVSLDQAIEIHAKALARRAGRRAPGVARQKAKDCATVGDHDGRGVWMRVATAAEEMTSSEVIRDDDTNKG